MTDTPATVDHHQVVSFHYDLFNAEGQAIESTRDGEPTLCLVGANNILPGLEQDMLGKAVGEKFSITLAPAMAYGLRDDSKRDRVSLKYLKHEGKLKPGQVVRLNTNQGQRTATVIKVGKFNADLDLNHPLAGQTIRFEVEITAIRPATEDEIAHGHAHGPGGHQH